MTKKAGNFFGISPTDPKTLICTMFIAIITLIGYNYDQDMKNLRKDNEETKTSVVDSLATFKSELKSHIDTAINDVKKDINAIKEDQQEMKEDLKDTRSEQRAIAKDVIKLKVLKGID